MIKAKVKASLYPLIILHKINKLIACNRQLAESIRFSILRILLKNSKGKVLKKLKTLTSQITSIEP